VDRRVFLQGSLGVAAALIGASRGTAASTGGSPPASPDVVIADRGLAGGRAFAEDARARGLAPAEFSSDAGGAWMRALEPRLRLGPTTIHGYTSAATLFCLELLARDYGARVVRRSETSDGLAWVLSSRPMQRAALAPLQQERSRPHA
jgi:hypothetical protein